MQTFNFHLPKHELLLRFATAAEFRTQVQAAADTALPQATFFLGSTVLESGQRVLLLDSARWFVSHVALAYQRRSRKRAKNGRGGAVVARAAALRCLRAATSGPSPQTPRVKAMTADEAAAWEAYRHANRLAIVRRQRKYRAHRHQHRPRHHEDGGPAG